jgi:tetratricopeptide (TPR) repeat protein
MQNLGYKDLASEGERLCKMGDCINGIKYFEEALKQFGQAYNLAPEITQEENTKQDGTKSSSDSIELDLNLIFEKINDTKSLNILSIIYNQMGNAYFYLQEYHKALECHRKDLELCERLCDEPGRAKSCGNIGNTLQVLGDYDEAIFYSLRNLEISRQLADSVRKIHFF